jgi:hypothetical protein
MLSCGLVRDKNFSSCPISEVTSYRDFIKDHDATAKPPQECYEPYMYWRTTHWSDCGGNKVGSIDTIIRMP